VIIIIVQNLDKKLAIKKVKPKNEYGKTKKREQLEFNLIEKDSGRDINATNTRNRWRNKRFFDVGGLMKRAEKKKIKIENNIVKHKN
jgi:hypothetical protein